MGRLLAWTVVLLGLFAFASGVIAIVIIRTNWANISQRNSSLIWLYVSLILIFIAALLAGINAELTIDTCTLPYSGKLATYAPSQPVYE